MMNYLYLLLAGALVAAQSNRRVIIKLKPTTSASHVSSFVNAHVEQQSTSNLDSFMPPDSIHLQFNSTSFTGLAGTFSDDFLTKLNATHADTIEYVEEDHPVKASLEQPRAPWGLARLSGFNKAVYSFPQSAGKGVDVYVIDSGLEASHPDFEGRAKFVANFVRGEGNQDFSGHGTHVAGTIAGRVFGVAKKANVYGLKVLDKTGTGFDSQIIAAITHVIDNKKQGIKTVINMSLGGHKSRALDDAITTAVNHGIVVVVAAGNEHTDACTLSPSGAKDALAVGAVDQQDRIARFSNYGPCVQLYAPGVGIASTSTSKSNGVKYMSGTSMASPHVAGAAALMMADKDYASAREVVQALKKSAMVFARDSSHPLLMASIRSLDSPRTPQAEEPTNVPEQPAPSEPRRRVRVPPPAPVQQEPQPREDAPQPRRKVPAPSSKPPVQHAPARPAPVERMPVQSPSIDRMPVQPAPVKSAPIESSPIESAPVQPAPADDAVPQDPQPQDSVDTTPLQDDVPAVIPSDHPLIIPNDRGSSWMITRPSPSDGSGPSKKPCNKKSTPGGDSQTPPQDVPGTTPEPVDNTPLPVDNSTTTDNSTATVPPVDNSTTVLPPAVDNSTVPLPSIADNSTAPSANSTVPAPVDNSTVPAPQSNITAPVDAGNSTVPVPPVDSPADKPAQPVLDGKCTDGAFRCRGKGFVKCDHSRWVAFSCAPGTECQQTSADVIVCNYPAPKKDCRSPSRDDSPSNNTNNVTIGNDDATMQLPGFEIPSNKTHANTTVPVPTNTTTVAAPVDATGPSAPAGVPPPAPSTPAPATSAPPPAASTPAPAGGSPVTTPSASEVSIMQPVENATPIVSEPVPETPKMVEAVPNKKNPWDTDSEEIAPIPL